MKEKLKLFVPFIFISATVSCGQGGSGLKLNRETYNNKIDTATTFASVVAPLKEKQIDENGIYQISSQGTVTSNISYNFTADKIYALFYEESYTDEPKVLADLSNVDKTYTNKIVISWDVNQNYLKVSDQKTGVYYATKDGNNRWWLCKTPADGSAKTKHDITDDVERDFRDFRNYIFNETTHALSTPVPYPYDTEGIELVAGFDLSGFIDTEATSNSTYYGNILSPMTILTYHQKEEWITVSTYIDILGILLRSMGYNYCFNASQDIDNNAYCEEIGSGDCCLTDIKDLYNSEMIQALLKYYEDTAAIELNESTGNANVNFFLNYKNNFIHQEEILVDLKDINFDLSAYLKGKGGLPDSFFIDCDIKKTNLNAIANLETTETCSVVDSINLDEYIAN